MPSPVIDAAKCTGCGQCVDVCPMSTIFELDKAAKKAVVKKPEDCIGCRACEACCTFAAVKVKD
ncbi:4Fe-4S binding protein [Candidatus Woesearchaeota archaeon]|nr:4Fe-4S binding protein [Candidatus Woesearchaeota archaeon]